jgi:AraC family transcriptional regulator
MLNPLTHASHQERVLAALVHVQDHLDDPLTFENLAHLTATAPHHFHRLFRALVGEAPAEHIRRLRLERAAHRLKVGSTPIVEVALEAGYGSHEAFTRAFTRTFGTSPSEFRETSGLSSRIAAPLALRWREGDASTPRAR